MRYLLGCDFGGGASKATLLGEDGRIISEASEEYATSYPRPGWAEQDPEDSLRAFLSNLKRVTAKSGVRPDQITAIALDGATHTAVLLDESDRVIRPCIYWTDQRAVMEARELERHSGEIARLTLNCPGALWTLPQLMWLKQNEPENFRRIRKLMSVKDYVRYRLNGDYVTDSIEACGFMLMDVRNRKWSETLCELAGLDRNLLPEIVEPDTVLSSVCRNAAGRYGLSADTKVIAGATDTAMEVYASGAVRAGQATVKLATAGRICAVTKEPMVGRNLVCYPHVIKGLWYPGTATKSCAASFRWYRDVFGEYEKEHTDDAFQSMADAAADIPPGADGLYFHPYLQGELTPYQDERLKGSFVGMRSSHTKAHFNRAVLEGIAYSLKDCMKTFREEGADIKEAFIIGGGARGKLWRQIVSDMLGIPLLKSERDDSSFGSAMLAGAAAGVFESKEEAVSRCTGAAERIYPEEERRRIYEQGFSDYKRIHDALAEVYHCAKE